jgi:hypothetical protein
MGSPDLVVGDDDAGRRWQRAHTALSPAVTRASAMAAR